MEHPGGGEVGRGEVGSALWHHGATGMDVTAGTMQTLRALARQAMLARGMLPDFSPAALRQVRAIEAAAAPGPGELVRDLRSLLWASIDNDDSRDLDQLSAATALPDGGTRLFVAIADVDALVRAGSPVDEHARTNTTSVYTVVETFTMLPERLSTDLTSLAEQQERLAIIVEMTVGADGIVSASDVYRAWVLNRAKLAYGGVGAWLEGAAPAPARLAAVPGLAQGLRLQDEAAQRLRRVRHLHGALSLETIEARPVFEGELLRDLRPDEKNRAKELIEDLMIAANAVTARFLAARGLPALRRVLRSPQRWSRIVALAGTLHESLPPAPDARALNQLLIRRRQADPEGFPDLCLSIVKLLGRGEYVLELPGEVVPGHFGLAVQDYTHATAPNRRFPDLITQRLIKAALSAQGSPYDAEQLRALAEHCTLQEDGAAKVERRVGKSAAALLLESRIGERFEAIVTGASDKGTWVRIRAPAIEGRVIRGFEGLDVGERVTVRLVHTDVPRGFIDFERVVARLA
jgi:VacB/RNase II family 3'-5' exoribonuclease